ncbi:MAG: putative glycoside hydrolase [Gemmatimonadaceae bacterium]|nr:putative glycoside hydrolase [Gemmatimonadaceae bacterium]
MRFSPLVAFACAALACDGAPPRAEGAPRAPATAESARPVPPTPPETPTPPARTPRPDSVRALYVNAWAAGSRGRMQELIRLADASEINAFIIDVKESDTYLAYTGTKIALAREIGADRRPATTWLPSLIDTLRAHGIYSVARIVVFKDRMLAERKPELAIRHENGSVWRDNKGGAWVNPYDRRVWDYNIAIAREALAMGFSELQWDYVRFPDVTDRMRAVMRFPGSNDVSRADNIGAFITYSKQQLREFDVPVTADVFGLVTHVEDDVGIGQNWEKVIAAADVVLPMVYPSHYYAGLYGFKRPIANPYEIVRLASTDAVERSAFVRDSMKQPVGEVMPWLEAMSIRGASFGPAEVRAQIQAVYDAGLRSWALWNPGSKYGVYADALRPALGGPSPVERRGWTAPRWDVPRERLSRVIVRRDRAARAAAPADSSTRSRAP